MHSCHHFCFHNKQEPNFAFRIGINIQYSNKRLNFPGQISNGLCLFIDFYLLFCAELFLHIYRAIQVNGRISLSLESDGCASTSNYVRYLEHVQSLITLSSSRRGEVQIYLVSPQGRKTYSNLLFYCQSNVLLRIVGNNNVQYWYNAYRSKALYEPVLPMKPIF